MLTAELLCRFLTNSESGPKVVGSIRGQNARIRADRDARAHAHDAGLGAHVCKLVVDIQTDSVEHDTLAALRNQVFNSAQAAFVGRVRAHDDQLYTIIRGCGLRTFHDLNKPVVFHHVDLKTELDFVFRISAGVGGDGLVNCRSRFLIRRDNAIGAGGVAVTELIQRMLRLFDQLRGQRLIFYAGNAGGVCFFLRGRGCRFGLLGFGLGVGLCRTAGDCRKQHGQRQNKRQCLPKFSHFRSPFLSFFDPMMRSPQFLRYFAAHIFYGFILTRIDFCKQDIIFAKRGKFLRFSTFLCLFCI